jgi:hypothetical protein
MKFLAYALAVLSFSLINPTFAQNSSDADAVVEAVKAKNPDIRGLCQKGPDGVRSAVTEAVAMLMSQGKLKGSPQAAGGEAGAKLARECRG